MANEFTKQETVAWSKMCAYAEDKLSMLNAVKVDTENAVTMARSNPDNTYWIPQPNVMLTNGNGRDQTSSFQNVTQLSVPVSINRSRTAPWTMEVFQARDPMRFENQVKAAIDRVASDINAAIVQTVCSQATQVVKRTNAPGTFADIDACRNIFDIQGYDSMTDRYIGICSQDSGGIVGDLANRQDLTPSLTADAYKVGKLNGVDGFYVTRMGYTDRVGAAAGTGLTINTTTAAGNFLIPKSRLNSGPISANQDNRYQQITISSTTGVVAGDCFTIAGINAVNLIAQNQDTNIKKDTGQLKTYRVMEVVNGTQLIISPAIISGQGGTDAEKQYQNCVNTAPVTNAAITFLNTRATNVNPFWIKDSILLVPGYLPKEETPGASRLYDTTEQGIQLTIEKAYSLATRTYEYRVDCFFGVNILNPEMAGILLFNQV